MSEIVLLVEPDGASWKLRPVTLKFPMNRIVERCALDPNDPKNPAKQWIRTWVNEHGERDESRQCRVFREVLPPIVEEKENPLYDEQAVKIKLGVDKATFLKIGKTLGRK